MPGAKIEHLDNGQVHFGFGLDPLVDQCLQRAAAGVADKEAALQALREAWQLAPNRLEVLQAMYKFHFYRGDLRQAEELVFQSLVRAAVQGGFSQDWKALDGESAAWDHPRGPARSFLYALKALAFVRLRQGASSQAEELLGVLGRLDPDDQVGAGVIRDLLNGVDGSDE